MLGLQRLLYGPLRPIEVEQLYEKAWFAITETCLAMTIFREEVGAWFVVMFVTLLIGRVWAWIGEGRVEILEQQPPSNPRLFHVRLSISLALSVLLDMYMLSYSINTVRQQARPNMMVMFAFEFAVLSVASLSTCARYGLSLREAAIIRRQTAARLQGRRHQITRDREAARRAAVEAGQEMPVEPPVEDMLDELDVDVPGWEDKGKWMFYLDLGTGKHYLVRMTTFSDIISDFFKLVLYLTFFCILCVFYGMPIHIIRDVALTIRSFYKRITDFMKYRHATRDMNQRYPDATENDLGGEEVCIICRETLRPWQRTGSGDLAEQAGTQDTDADERLRPKKLPCGHILHLACLRSWLERQQNCPTCRQPVITTSPNPQPSQRGEAHNQADADGRGDVAGGRVPQQPQQAGQNRLRFFNLGPIRLGFGAGPDVQDLAQQLHNNQAPRAQAAPNRDGGVFQQIGVGLGLGRQRALPNGTEGRPSQDTIRAQIRSIEQQLLHDIEQLRLQAEQLRAVRALQGELARLRIAQANHETDIGAYTDHSNPFRANQHGSSSINPTLRSQTFGITSRENPSASQHRELPAGVVIPDGWTFLPLQRLGTGLGNQAMQGGTFRDPVQQSRNPSNSNNVNLQAPPQRQTTTSHPQQNSNVHDALSVTSGRTSTIRQTRQSTASNRVAAESSLLEQESPAHLQNLTASSAQNGARQQTITSEQIQREGGMEMSQGSSATEPQHSFISQSPAQSLHTARDDSPESAEVVERRLSKGKARATTVEDVEDGEDGE